MSIYFRYKSEAISLRREGKTYTEIQDAVSVKIPSSTLHAWFKSTHFTRNEKNRIALRALHKIQIGHLKAIITRRRQRHTYLESVCNRLLPLHQLLDKNVDVAKIVLMMLYWCEGSKHSHGSLAFGNSDPRMIRLFLSLIRRCYIIDETKFRITIQCRYDQHPEILAIYWQGITGIPLSQFYKPNIDRTTIGKPSRKPDYKGVCRIDYFSAKIYHELVLARTLF